MKNFLLFLLYLPHLIYSICSGAQYWNPLNNACVDCTLILLSRMPMECSQSLLRGPLHQYVRYDLSYYSKLLRR